MNNLINKSLSKPLQTCQYLLEIWLYGNDRCPQTCTCIGKTSANVILSSVSLLFFSSSSIGKGYLKESCDVGTSCVTLNEDEVILNRPVDVWVEARVGNSSCQSNKKSVTLHHTGADAHFHHFSISKKMQTTVCIKQIFFLASLYSKIWCTKKC